MFRSSLKLSILTLGLLAAACTQGFSDDDNDAQTAALGRRAPGGIDPLPPVIGPGGGGTVVKRTAPRVVSRSASGRSVSVTFDRALEANEVPLSRTEVMVVRKSGGDLATRNVGTGAALSADKRTITFSLSEDVRAGASYQPRGVWQPCSGSTSGWACKERPARFGFVDVKSARTSPTDVLTANAGFAFLLANGAAAAPVSEVTLPADPAPAAQGTFRVKRITPGDAAVDVPRDTQQVVVEFEGGTIDCAATGRGQDTFHLYTDDSDVRFPQSMYNAPNANTSASGDYRGRLLCEETENRLKFILPGLLKGGAHFKIELNGIRSQQGNVMNEKVMTFITQKPGLEVLVTRVENHYGGDNTCDDDWIGKNFCDVYVTTAVASTSTNMARRIPEQGDFSEMRDYRADAIHGSRDIWPPRPIFTTEAPVSEIVSFQAWAFDADKDSAWKGILNTAAGIAAAAGTALLPIQPQYGAIAEGVAGGLKGLAALIPSNEDDLMGSIEYNLTKNTGRWHTESGLFTLDLTKNAPNRGPVKLTMFSQEVPRSWAPPPRID